MKNWFSNLESKAKRLFSLITIITVIGTSSLTQVLTSYNRKIKSQNTMIQVLAAQLQTIHPSIYTGEVEIFRRKMFGLWNKSEGVYPVVIRYGDYFNEKESRTETVYWVYLRVSGVSAIYHAVPYDGSFYYWDWNKDIQWIYNLKKVE